VPSYPQTFECRTCGKEFTPEFMRGWHLRKYCDDHMVGNTSGKLKAAQRSERGRCERCGKLMPNIRRKGAKYCSADCTSKAGTARYQARRKHEVALAEQDHEIAQGTKINPNAIHRGPLYRKALDHPSLLRDIDEGRRTLKEGSLILDCTEASMSRIMNTWRYDQRIAIAKGEWMPSPLVAAQLPTDELKRIKELGPSGEDTEEFELLADHLTRAYSVFSRRFFRLEGARPEIEGFHLAWIRSIIVAYAVGGKQMILSPPRHGKSELLVRFCVWMIVMFPNIRIMWVAANTDVSKIMIGAVKDHLENNEELIGSALPPGGKFRPDRNLSRPWSSKEIKVGQQSHVGQKSSSMLALGRTAKILSRDVDLLITDDLEDFDTTREPSQRQYSRNKLAEIGTRKEEKTAWVYIASRQHPDDVPQHIMQLEGTPQAWRTIVDTAHQDCQLDPDVISGHDENGCVLFPKVRSYRWLMEKKGDMEALGVPGAYEMRYLNKPVPETGIVFEIKTIREKALDRSRDIGIDELPPGLLVAGLDPAARGTQAAFCWHYANDVMTMVDLETQDAGGFEGAHDVMERWHDMYGLTSWFYEDNSQQIEFFGDPRTRELQNRLGLSLRPHTTGKNKMDPELGISSMAPRYHNGGIILPYGTASARQKVNMLLRQLELWTTDGVVRGKGKKTDIKMASWFPFPHIVKYGQKDRQVTLRQGAELSYPSMDRFDNTPWQTNYPGGR
jgi:hypothetical protein